MSLEATAASDLELLNAPDMSLRVAESLVNAVRAEAANRGLALAAAVVDRGGNVVAAVRMDHAQLGALSLAENKAVTAVSFGHPTAAWTQSSAPGGSDWGLAHTLEGRAIVFPGGVPAYSNGHLIGAIGVSGAASVVDAECAEHAVLTTGLEASA